MKTKHTPPWKWMVGIHELSFFWTGLFPVAILFFFMATNLIFPCQVDSRRGRMLLCYHRCSRREQAGMFNTRSHSISLWYILPTFSIKINQMYICHTWILCAKNPVFLSIFRVFQMENKNPIYPFLVGLECGIPDSERKKSQRILRALGNLEIPTQRFYSSFIIWPCISRRWETATVRCDHTCGQSLDLFKKTELNGQI